MSSQRGNCAKSGPRKHQNTTAYRNDLHRKKDKTMKILNSLQITGCCKRCKEVIEWKIKYNKYKPLTRPKKCVKCLQKSVTNSYYILCQSCIESENLCGKCALIPPADASAESSTAVGNECRLNEDNAKSKEDKNKLDDGKDKLNEGNVKACGDKLSTNVDKGEDDQSELDEDESDDDEDGEEDDGDDEEDEDDD